MKKRFFSQNTRIQILNMKSNFASILAEKTLPFMNLDSQKLYILTNFSHLLSFDDSDFIIL